MSPNEDFVRFRAAYRRGQTYPQTSTKYTHKHTYIQDIFHTYDKTVQYLLISVVSSCLPYKCENTTLQRTYEMTPLCPTVREHHKPLSVCLSLHLTPETGTEFLSVKKEGCKQTAAARVSN